MVTGFDFGWTWGIIRPQPTAIWTVSGRVVATGKNVLAQPLQRSRNVEVVVYPIAPLRWRIGAHVAQR